MDINEVTEKPRGKLSWVLRDEHGNIKAEGMTTNQIQDAHNDAVATQVDSSPAQASGLYQFMWVGTGAMGATAATNLTTPVAGGRQAVTSSTSAAGVVTTVATLAAGVGTGALTEAGMFTSNAGADMMCTAAIVITKAAGDSLTLSWAVTFP